MAAPTADIDPDIWTRIVELAGGRLVIPQTEVCRALGITTDTLNAEIEAGRLRYVLVGSRKKFKPSDLAHYIERQTRGALVPTQAPPIELGDVVSFEEALARTAPMLAAKREATLVKKRREAKRHDAWLKAQRAKE